MQKDTMYDRLYNDYTATRHEWEQALDDLGNALTTLADVRRSHAETTDAINIFEYSALAAETHKEGQINGSNAEKRKTQTVLLLASMADTNAEYKALLTADDDSRRRIDELEIEIESLKGKISFLRNMARMNAGLAHALVG